ncbi:MAG: fibrobacter succinogenes major paralogous domain-containing protein [Fibromonadaceae bacterium]|jgi:uncharacterized protein (TIGR02145 family)|nr:fibrobacter succinogenes major paralogous domain-containing protein [Fibromonadaceae bacterium]
MNKHITASLLALLCIAACDQQKGTFTDTRDGKTYKTTKIGEQVWMAENLNYEEDGSKCYNDSISYCDKYGRLYDWNTATKVCPSGWHLPSGTGWNVLMKFVNPRCSDNSHCAGAEAKLKAKSGWNDGKGKSGNGTDDYAFSALPGGNGNFFNVGDYGGWWSASEYSNSSAYLRGIYYGSVYVVYDSYDKSLLFSVRCLQGLRRSHCLNPD